MHRRKCGTHCGRNFRSGSWQQIVRQWHILKFRRQCTRFHFNDIRIVRWHRFFAGWRVIVAAAKRWIWRRVQNGFRIVNIAHNLRLQMALEIRTAAALSRSWFVHHRWHQWRWIEIQFAIYWRLRYAATARCGACTRRFGNTRARFTVDEVNKIYLFYYLFEVAGI